MIKAIERIQHAVEMAERARNPSYCDQFKKAIIFSAHVDEDGNVIEPTCCEQFWHFCSIGWKVGFEAMLSSSSQSFPHLESVEAGSPFSFRFALSASSLRWWQSSPLFSGV